MLHNQRRQAVTQAKLKETLIGFVRCMTATIDAKDRTTGGHSERVARMAVRLGKELQLQETVLGDIYLAGILHDIGKIGIQDSILQKPDKLTAEEFDHLKQHVVIGDRIISNLKPFHHLRPGVRNHHERWDGRGYPDGLRGAESPLLARLLAVADACDAMLSPRPYRAAMPVTKMEAILLQGAGSQWDASIVEHFMQCRDDLYSICFDGGAEMLTDVVERAMLITDNSYVAPGSV
jgi:HD-GYP domain-containing protein (c-di-GMP phosphodiesterase class II)